MTQIKLKNMKNQTINILFVFSFVILFFSCQSKTEKRLIGLWAVELDSCIVLKRPWIKEVCDNFLTISQNQKCNLPSLCKQNIQQSEGTWQFTKGKNIPDKILFNVPDNPLHGQYIITFYKDYNSMKFKMKLQNDSTILICSKSVLSFTSNQNDLLDNQ